MIENMKCKNCGASLRRQSYGIWVCDYCGSVYRTDDEINFIEVYHLDTIKLSAAVSFPMELERYRGDDEVASLAIRDLSYKLAKELPKYMTIRKDDDPFEMRRVFRGDIRIVNTKDALLRGVIL